MVDQSASHKGDGFKAAMGMGGEPRNHAAVVHAPAVEPGEVRTDAATGDSGYRAECWRSGGVAIIVMGAEQKRVHHGPLGTQGSCLDHDR